MSVYHTVEINRAEAIERLMQAWKMPSEMSNYELEEALFNTFGRENLPGTTLENFIVKE